MNLQVFGDHHVYKVLEQALLTVEVTASLLGICQLGEYHIPLVIADGDTPSAPMNHNDKTHPGLIGTAYLDHEWNLG